MSADQLGRFAGEAPIAVDGAPLLKARDDRA
jgi:hypothetical protein